MSSHRISTRIVSGEQDRLEIDDAILKVLSGPDRGLEVPLEARSFTVGSSVDCDLVLHDPTVSARHAEIVMAGGGYAIRDLASKNGVVIGSVPVERAPLCDGMRIRLAGSVLGVRSLKRRRVVALARAGEFRGLVAHSTKMRAFVASLEQIAVSNLAVLIEGETGTGKEVAAQALHAVSPRRDGPFVTFDCGAVVPSLIAAELFGHERGAFTGAGEARPGLLEEAEGGTLFFDEIGELPFDVQPMLLGALDRKVSRRIGGKRERTHDVRVVAATHRNLAEEVKAKRFREDLFFRLAVARLRLPPLRERLEDLSVLAGQFAEEAGVSLTPELLAPFLTYEWRGNVRELRNTIARLAAQPSPDGLPGEGSAALPPLPEARRRANEEFERRYVADALARTRGNVTRAAELAGVSVRMLQRLVAKHGLRLPPG